MTNSTFITDANYLHPDRIGIVKPENKYCMCHNCHHYHILLGNKDDFSLIIDEPCYSCLREMNYHGDSGTGFIEVKGNQVYQTRTFVKGRKQL